MENEGLEKDLKDSQVINKRVPIPWQIAGKSKSKFSHL